MDKLIHRHQVDGLPPKRDNERSAGNIGIDQQRFCASWDQAGLAKTC